MNTSKEILRYIACYLDKMWRFSIFFKISYQIYKINFCRINVRLN